MLRLIAIALLVITTLAARAEPHPFVHPGLLHNREDLDLIQRQVAANIEPWKSGFEKLRADPQSRADYRLRGPFATVTRAPGAASLHNAEMVSDGNAAYQNALMWCITGEDAHAKKAVEILNAWSRTLKTMDGRDVQLSAGLNGFKFVSAAELMRATYPKWEAADVAQCQAMLKSAVYPPIKDFAIFANGNWDAACMKAMIAIGVFCDDRAMYDRAVDYFKNGSGNGRLTHYVINDAGQCQESGRDQPHTQLGLALLAETCEIAWHQGDDLYATADNRLLKGFEYTARYNLGEDVPFVTFTDTTGKYTSKKISPQGRGQLRPMYELVWNHYTNRRGIDAPCTKRAADKLRPEGAGPGSDNTGFGTLLFTRPSATANK